MGSAFSARNRVVSSEGHVSSNHGYFYPSIGGLNYFSSHYYLGSKKFETADPENFLYGDLPDLNYMTHSPCPFPYKQPPKRRPIDCLNAVLFVHKETVKLVKISDDDDSDGDGDSRYTVQFKFDADCKCNVYVMCMLSKLVDMSSLKSGTVSDSGCWLSQRYSFEKGLEQDFSEKSLIIPVADFAEDQLSFDPLVSSSPYPLVILVETENNSGFEYQSLMTICNFEKSSSSSQNLSIKVLKQKFLIDGLEYIFHEIFGLENKVPPKQQNEATSATEEEESDDDDEDDEDDLGAECVICFTDVKDTIILPCRHFCLCASCAADLRYQASNCPICRAPFQALVQIQATQKILKDEEPDDDEISNNPEESMMLNKEYQLYSVPGFKVMSLLQALNGYPKIKKNDTSNDANAPILFTTDTSEDNNNGGGFSNSSLTTAGAEDTAITIEPSMKEVVISLDDNDQDPSLINAEPLVETRGHQLPDLIPPGSIPGTPEDQQEEVEGRACMPVGVSIVASMESGQSSSSCTTDKNSVTSTDELFVTEGSLSSQRTETSSLKSSTGSVGSTDALIRRNSK